MYILSTNLYTCVLITFLLNSIIQKKRKTMESTKHLPQPTTFTNPEEDLEYDVILNELR